ncbi:MULTISPECIES: prolyl aminopeptidase [Nocardiopsidaceae]|uniref:Proline iminopeptidase n=2 Tax=Nocardiopsidaceae TaxID=83676 RepID=A0ABY6YVX9_9ACTN|nr:prolyl aminopeptidase [Streptomonospora nanhaiensis]WAE76417.1 prolyl aminopeptidase [Streptomonospora nanhaiensis]
MTAPTPHTQGLLPTADGHHLYWHEYGNPRGHPALVLHGGPGSGCHPAYTDFFDTDRYRVIMLDQRGSGRSTPNARHTTTDLSTNTTHHLIHDIEALRTHHRLTTWHVLGLSWGCTLGLAYAQAHPEHVSALILAAVTNTTAAEVHWLTHAMGRVFPEEWELFRHGAGPGADPHDLSTAYAHRLAHPDPQVRFDAARAWCRWEDVHVSTAPGHTPHPAFADPAFRMTFARLVTHYWSHAAFLPDGQLQRDAHRLAGTPGAMVHGRMDISGPADIAYRLSLTWTDADLVVVEEAGHGAGTTTLKAATRAATDRLAP